MTNKEKLISRLANWKFAQAKQYVRPDGPVTADLQDLITKLAELWGNTGHSSGGGVFDIILEYTVNKLVDDVRALPDF